MKPPKPVEESVYEFASEQLVKDGIKTLPVTLKEAIDALENDLVILNIFASAGEKYLQIKKQERQEFVTQVTSLGNKKIPLINLQK